MMLWCFILASLTHEQALQALRASLTEAGLPAEQVQITLKGLSPESLPAGTLRFPWSGLARPSFVAADSVLLWRGELISEGGHATPVWARVQMTIQRTGVVSARPIPAGRPITADSLRISGWTASVLQSAPAQEAEGFVGASLTRSVPAGTPLFPEMLASRGQVLAGDRIHVESIAGGARITFDAIAENRANPGERVYFRNPMNGRRVAGQSALGHRVVLSWENQP